MLVASHVLTPATALNYCGGADGVALKLKNAQAAKDKFEKTGEVDYIHIVQENQDDKTALLCCRMVLTLEKSRTLFCIQRSLGKRITQMSELDIWGHDITPIFQKLHLPVLMIHSDNAATGAEIPKKLFAVISSKEKKLVWFEEKQVQFQFYEESLTIDRAVNDISKWIKD